MGFFLFWELLCRTNKFYVSTPVYTALSHFSDQEGQRFESSRSHQEQYLMGCCSFCFARILWGSKRDCFARILWGSKREDSNSPCPAFCVPRGRNAQWGVSRARLDESSRSHQEQHLIGCCSFCFAWILWSSKRADSNSPCPAQSAGWRSCVSG